MGHSWFISFRFVYTKAIPNWWFRNWWCTFGPNANILPPFLVSHFEYFSASLQNSESLFFRNWWCTVGLYDAKTGLPWIMQWGYSIDIEDSFPLLIQETYVEWWSQTTVNKERISNIIKTQVIKILQGSCRISSSSSKASTKE